LFVRILFSGERSLGAIRFFIQNLFLGLDDWIGNPCPHAPTNPQPKPTIRTQRSESQLPGMKPVLHHDHAHHLRITKTDKASRPHSKQHHQRASNDLYTGTYTNQMYGDLTITDASDDVDLVSRLFPHHSVADAPVTLILTWQVLTLGLSTWTGVTYNATLPSPWSLVFAPEWPNIVVFEFNGSAVSGVYWIVDNYAPPLFNKTA
jgi:hypothetical protein